MPAESALPAVTFGVKVLYADPGHIHFDLFAGRNEHARGRVGRQVLRVDEFVEYVRRLAPEVIVRDGVSWRPRQDQPSGALRDAEARRKAREA